MNDKIAYSLFFKFKQKKTRQKSFKKFFFLSTNPDRLFSRLFFYESEKIYILNDSFLVYLEFYLFNLFFFFLFFFAWGFFLFFYFDNLQGISYRISGSRSQLISLIVSSAAMWLRNIKKKNSNIINEKKKKNCS